MLTVADCSLAAMTDALASPTPVSPQREANVAYANSLMETEPAQRSHGVGQAPVPGS